MGQACVQYQCDSHASRNTWLSIEAHVKVSTPHEEQRAVETHFNFGTGRALVERERGVDGGGAAGTGGLTRSVMNLSLSSLFQWLARQPPFVCFDPFSLSFTGGRRRQATILRWNDALKDWD
jgi:hypothetical protein